MINVDHIIELEKAKEETERDYINTNKNYLITTQQVIKSSRVIFYCPFNQSYTFLEKYEIKEIMDLLMTYQKDNFFILQIDNDNLLYEEILKRKFKSEFENIHKMFDLKLDYCFSPLDELLCFNLSVLTNIDSDEVEKFLIQIFFSKNGLYIINKDCCDNILDIFTKKFNFRELQKDEFFEKAFLLKNNEDVTINNFNFISQSKNYFKNSPKKMKTKKNFSKKNSVRSIENPIEEENFEDCTQSKTQSAVKDNSCIGNFNFSTDDLIYYLLNFSLDKLEEYANYLVKEAESLKGIYLELSQNERKDFFRRIHNMEVSLQLIYQETVIKKKFLKYSKAQFKVYNNLSNDFYFKNTFTFFIELMISKVTELEINFEKLKNTIKMIKENYSIIIEDNTEKQNIKLNNVMKVLAIMTTVYTPFNVIPNFFGMNIKVPWQEDETLWPFFGVLMVCVSLLLIELWVFRKLKWF